ncbi:hypothetical protein BO86DRAFT_416310 [Aspergillus japonicus CBS 114.51]|uniref:Uncharacterized protein n=1 Tax=Aspergillus japonicus CBS 114.51 TaxID=1448312 RepID=A0A8T8XB39_ASPJA|nr:hypothetical protein BO86DRAFT_416310 [Aspergillus japonicus CBS 114.51]RAH85437.1 hypothetical protein BO86DRAFT_416310 [Aspergillus japonicus CBS 114.51]
MEDLTKGYRSDFSGLKPFEKAAAVRKIQNEILAGLPLNTIYVVLYVRADPPIANDFHWGLYFHTDKSGAFKYHVKNPSTDGKGWLADHGRTGGLLKSNLLCVVNQIARVPSDKVAQIDPIMRSYDGNLNAMPGITCRVWVLAILQKLMDQGIVRCSSVKDLEAECLSVGNGYMVEAANSRQPRPIVKSPVCL